MSYTSLSLSILFVFLNGKRYRLSVLKNCIWASSFISSCWAEFYNHKKSHHISNLYSNPSTITLLYKCLLSGHNWNPLGLLLIRGFLWRIWEDSRTCRNTETSVLKTCFGGFTVSMWVPPLRACRFSQVLPQLHWATARAHKLQEKWFLNFPKKYFF